MKINEITRPESIVDADDFLRSRGYHRIGRGSFAGVYQKQKDQVLKLFVSEDASFRKFLEMIKSANNPHFPVALGNPIRINDTYYGIKLKQLEPIEGSLAYNLSVACSRYINDLQLGRQPSATSVAFKWIQPYTRSFDEFDQACKMIAQMMQTDDDISLDISESNIMFRGNILVFSDPVTSRMGWSADEFEFSDERAQQPQPQDHLDNWK